MRDRIPAMNIDTTKPVLEFFEDGDWLRVEGQGRRTRYLRKELAQNLLTQLYQHSVTEKSNIIVREMEIV